MWQKHDPITSQAVVGDFGLIYYTLDYLTCTKYTVHEQLCIPPSSNTRP